MSRVLADLDRAQATFESELARGVERDHRQRLSLADPAILHHLGGLEVQMAVQLLAVALDADIDPGLGQQGGVERNRIVGLDLVGPPVRERGGTGAVVADLGGDLVALEDVLERLDLDAVALGGAQQHQDLVAAVAMTVNLDRSLDDLGQGLEPQIPARGRTGLVLVLLPGLLVALPFRKVRLALLERPLDHRLDTHPRIGKSTRATGSRSHPGRTSRPGGHRGSSSSRPGLP